MWLWPLYMCYEQQFEHFVGPQKKTKLQFYKYMTSKKITLLNFQLDAQNSYLFIYNTFINILHLFRALPCSSSGGLRRNCIYMQPPVSSLPAGDCLVHRLRKNSFLTGAQDSHLQRVKIPEAANPLTPN